LKRINQCEVKTRIKVLTSETTVRHSSEQDNVRGRRVTFPQSVIKVRPPRRSVPTSGISESIRSGFSTLKRRFLSISNLSNLHTSMSPKPRKKLTSIFSKRNPHSSIALSLRGLSISTPNLTYGQESPINDDYEYEDVFNTTEENDNQIDRPDVYSEATYSKASAELQDYPWFVGIMNVNDANAKLQYHRNGTFLVRESVTQKDKFIISIIFKKETKHITIEEKSGIFKISDSSQFRSIPDLIAFYMKHSLSDSYPTLPTVLVRWIPTEDVVVVQFPYTAKNEKELSLRTGARISVIERDGNWWYGELDGKLGYFPKNFVEDASSRS